MDFKKLIQEKTIVTSDNRVLFANCDLEGYKFINADLSCGVTFMNVNLRNVEFTGADLSDVEISGSETDFNGNQIPIRKDDKFQVGEYVCTRNRLYGIVHDGSRYSWIKFDGE